MSELCRVTATLCRHAAVRSCDHRRHSRICGRTGRHVLWGGAWKNSKQVLRFVPIASFSFDLCMKTKKFLKMDSCPSMSKTLTQRCENQGLWDCWTTPSPVVTRWTDVAPLLFLSALHSGSQRLLEPFQNEVVDFGKFAPFPSFSWWLLLKMDEFERKILVVLAIKCLFPSNLWP